MATIAKPAAAWTTSDHRAGAVAKPNASQPVKNAMESDARRPRLTRPPRAMATGRATVRALTVSAYGSCDWVASRILCLIQRRLDSDQTSREVQVRGESKRSLRGAGAKVIPVLEEFLAQTQRRFDGSND